MKKYRILIVTVSILFGGIFLVLPRYYYHALRNELKRSTSCSFNGKEKAAIFLGIISLKNFSCVFSSGVAMTSKHLSIRYPYRDVIDCRNWHLKVYGEDVSMKLIDKGKDFFGVNALLLKSVDVRLVLSRNKSYSFEVLKAQGDFGSVSGGGTISSDKFADIKLHILLTRSLLEQLPISLGSVRESNAKTIDVRCEIKGILPHPRIDVSSDLFQFTLQGSDGD
jgi:hypothetical protein